MSHFAKPLARRQNEVAVSLGGPLVSALGTTIPAPMLMVSGRHGLRDDLAIGAHFNATAAAYGVVHVAPSLSSYTRTAGPAVALSFSPHVLFDREDLRVALHFSGAATWELNAGHLVYLGGEGATLVPAADFRVLVGPLLGGHLRVSRSVAVGAEIKWLGPYVDTEPMAPTWVSPGNRGYLSVLLGASFAFGCDR